MANQTSTPLSFTIPGLSTDQGRRAADMLQERLVALIDLSLTLKHVHWNVVGPNFIGVHQMLDPQVESVRKMVDETAERIATLGLAPNGLPGALVSMRSWDDYALQRALVSQHLGALDIVYHGVIESHRRCIDELASTDPVSQDMLIGQAADLEQFHWFVRAHLESSSGVLSTHGATSEEQAARQAGEASNVSNETAGDGRSPQVHDRQPAAV